MMAAAAILLAVSKELAAQAKSSLPELREEEQIQREWYENGIYSRETMFKGEIFLSQYDFRKRECCQMAVTEKSERQSLK